MTVKKLSEPQVRYLLHAYLLMGLRYPVEVVQPLFQEYLEQFREHPLYQAIFQEGYRDGLRQALQTPSKRSSGSCRKRSRNASKRRPTRKS